MTGIDIPKLTALLAKATPAKSLTVDRYKHGGARVYQVIAPCAERLVAEFFEEKEREAWIEAFDVLPSVVSVIPALYNAGKDAHDAGVMARDDAVASRQQNEALRREVTELRALLLAWHRRYAKVPDEKRTPKLRGLLELTRKAIELQAPQVKP